MQWTDVSDIAIELAEAYPQQNPLELSFTDLYQRVLDLDGFEGDPDHCGEKILEAIQMAWLDEQN